MLSQISSVYKTMGDVFTDIFGERVIMFDKNGNQHMIDGIFSPDSRVQDIRGDSQQTRDYALLSLKRQQLVNIFGVFSDLVVDVQSSRFIIRGVEYVLDDVVDDTQIMIEGRVYLASSPSANPQISNKGPLKDKIL